MGPESNDEEGVVNQPPPYFMSRKIYPHKQNVQPPERRKTPQIGILPIVCALVLGIAIGTEIRDGLWQMYCWLSHDYVQCVK